MKGRKPPKGAPNMSKEIETDNSRPLTYSQAGDYLLPDLILEEQASPVTEETIGKYGRMRKNFLKQHRAMSYNSLLLGEKLYHHLREIDRTANERMEQLMKELTGKNPPPDKTTDQMGWVSHMNSLKAQAEETILNELIYN
ncbi:TnpV protein [Desulfitibacter alkalitolerans]|uniref:TnpV protein n=2 Tax=Clostridia TaxID=186801 RepID=UPI002E8E2BFB|nr:TnpV protein [Geosporobacter subterraneus]